MSNATVLFPLPLIPVMTVKRLCGISISMLLRLCSRALRTWMALRPLAVRPWPAGEAEALVEVFRRRVPVPLRRDCARSANACQAALYLRHFPWFPRAHDFAAGVSSLGTQVDDPVAGLDDIQVVFDDDQGMTDGKQAPECRDEGRHIVEVQTRCGFVEQQQLRAVAGLRQMAGEFEALGLAAAQGRHRLTKLHVVEADSGKGREGGQDFRAIGKEFQCLSDGHVEHIRHGLGALPFLAASPGRRCELHLEHLGTVTAAVTIRAAQIHVAQELHLHVLESVSATGGTAAGAGVEAEGPRRIATLPGQRLLGEQLSDGVQSPHVAGGIGACRLTNG